jgi:hypothetical protein
MYIKFFNVVCGEAYDISQYEMILNSLCYQIYNRNPVKSHVDEIPKRFFIKVYDILQYNMVLNNKRLVFF